MIGDFNAKSKDWYSIDITSFEGSELDFLTSQCEILQIRKEITYIFDNSRFFIDVIFTFELNMVTDFSFMVLYTGIVTSKLYTQSLIFIRHHMTRQCDISSM